MKARGGQVTIFIILGIVIVILFASLLLLDTTETDGIDDVLPERDAIEKYVSSCLEIVSKDALVLMGMQGGYIELPETYASRNSYLQELNGGVKVPYWLYQGKFLIPTSEQMELEIANYIESNLDECLALESLSDVDEYETGDEMEIDVSINQDDVSVVIDYPISIINDERATTYNEFWAIIDIQMQKILSAASYLADRHYYDMFVDQATVNILSMDPEIPLGGINFDCTPMVWRKSEVQTKVQEYLRTLIPTIRVGGTDFLPFKEQLSGENPMALYEYYDSEWDLDRIEAEGGLPDEVWDEVPEDMYQYLHLYWDMEDFDWNGINVGLSYFPNYGMTMNVNPSSGDRIEAVPGNSEYDYLRFLCINIYHFTYDIEYPIKVGLYDDEAFGGEGYNFDFALPVSIEHNFPTRDPVNYYQMDAIQSSPEFCNLTYDDKTSIAAKDYFSGEFIDGVKVTYDCIKYYCDLGETSTRDNVGVPLLQANLPMGCANPFFKFEHDNYVEIKEQVVDIDDSLGVELRMLPLKDIRFKNTGLTGVQKSDMYGSAVFIRNEEFDYEEFVTDSVVGGQNVVKLIDSPGITYQVDVTLMTNSGLVGGWMGNMTVYSEDMAKDTINFKVYEKLPHPNSDKEQMDLFLYLEEDDPLNPYRDEYAPEFS